MWSACLPAHLDDTYIFTHNVVQQHVYNVVYNNHTKPYGVENSVENQQQAAPAIVVVVPIHSSSLANVHITLNTSPCTCLDWLYHGFHHLLSTPSCEMET